MTLLPVYLFAALTALGLSFAYRQETAAAGPVPSPGLLASFVLFLYYILPAFCYGLFPEWSEFRRYYYGYSDEMYNYTAFLGSLSIAAVYAGYRAGIRRIPNRSPRIVSFLSRKISAFPTYSIFASGILIFAIGSYASYYRQSLQWNHYGGVLSVYDRSFSIANNFLATVESFNWFAYYLFLYLLLDNRLAGIARPAVVAMIAYFIANCVISGGAAPLIMAAFGVFAFYAYRNDFKGDSVAPRSRRISLPRYAATAVIVVIVAFGLKQVARNTVDLEDRTLSLASLADDFGVVSEVVGKTDFGATVEHVVTSFHGADSMAVIVTRHESGNREFQNGNMFWLVGVAFVPRFLYPAKPDIALGMWFTDNYWRHRSEVESTGQGVQGTAFLLPGEFYMNFGFPGVPLGMFLVGLLIAWYTRSFFGHPETGLVGYVFAASLTFGVVHHLFSFASYVSGWVRQFTLTTLLFVVVTVLCGLLTRMRTNRERLWLQGVPR